MLSSLGRSLTLEYLGDRPAGEESSHEEDELRVGLTEVERHQDVLSCSRHVLRDRRVTVMTLIDWRRPEPFSSRFPYAKPISL